MTWTAPAVQRINPPGDAAERSSLEAFLEYQRQTLMWKCSDLPGEDLARRGVPPSSLSLLGLIRHMALVEQSWFRVRLARQPEQFLYVTDDEPDREFDAATADAAHEDFDIYAQQLEHSRQVLAAHGLDDTFTVQHRHGEVETLSVRWLLLHMIEEYARHNGHADLLRERIDGAVGE